MADELQVALRQAENAEAALIEEYRVWRQTWDRNPILDALKEGILALRALRAAAEKPRG